MGFLSKWNTRACTKGIPLIESSLYLLWVSLRCLCFHWTSPASLNEMSVCIVWIATSYHLCLIMRNVWVVCGVDPVNRSWELLKIPSPYRVRDALILYSNSHSSSAQGGSLIVRFSLPTVRTENELDGHGMSHSQFAIVCHCDIWWYPSPLNSIQQIFCIYDLPFNHT